jgi:hypothetical protein
LASRESQQLARERGSAMGLLADFVEVALQAALRFAFVPA